VCDEEVKDVRRGFTAAEKTELWSRWQRGEVAESGLGPGVWQAIIVHLFPSGPHGGIRPAPRRRSRLALTISEREEISRGIATHQSARSMARLLGRSPSTVSREISRNGGYISIPERRRPMRGPGAELVVRNGVSWRTVRGYDRRCEEAQIGLVARADSRLAEASASRR